MAEALGPRTRSAITAVLVVVMWVVLLAAGVAIYGFKRQQTDPAIVMLVAVAGFAIVDLWIRPRREEHGMHRLRRFMPLWAIVPFVLALMMSAWVQYQQWQNALKDIHELAGELDRDPAIHQQGEKDQRDQITSEAANEAIANADRLHFPWRRRADAKPAEPAGASAEPTSELADDTDDGRAEKQRFIELARVIGHDLARVGEQRARLREACKRADCVAACAKNPGVDGWCKNGEFKAFRLRADEVAVNAQRDTRFDVCLAFFVQAIFVLWIPLLLVISIARAHGRLSVSARCPALAPARLPALRSRLDDERDRRIVAEDRAFFLPRLCFGALMVLGMTYVFAPFGLKTSYMMSLVEAHALPGHTSFVLWCNHFTAVPVIVVGFVGFLTYALITATRRFAEDDLDDVAIFSLLVRGLIVILLSFALSSSPVGDLPARLFVFIAGVFPIRALEAIAKRANITLDPEFTPDTRSFVGIPNLDPSKVFTLRAAGVQSTYDLAAMPIEEIVGRVRIDPRLLGRAVDRAILIDAVGLKVVEELAPFAIGSATELVDARDKLPRALVDKLGDAAQRAADRLAGDLRVVRLRAWLASAPDQLPAGSAVPDADHPAVVSGKVVGGVADDHAGDDGEPDRGGADDVPAPPDRRIDVVDSV